MASKRRRGRPRKNGPRHGNGHLKRQPAASPRAIAARMPHRSGLGDRAVEQNAESELGRMVLRGELDPTLALAGETYARLWRGYLATLDAPRWPWRGQGRETACVGCPAPDEREFCRCDLLRRIWLEAYNALKSTGSGVEPLVRRVVIDDVACPWQGWGALIRGLSALAYKFGLTRRGKSARSRNSSIPNTPVES
jgi:hypothetical protein